MGQRLADMRWTEVRAALEAGAVGVLPIGAAAKAHGPHLPMGTDFLTAESLGAALADRADVVVWPTVGYGYYPAFVDFAGSTSLPESVFTQTLDALVGDIQRAGARRVLLMNTGISTIPAVDRACRAPHVRAAHVYRGAKYLAAVRAHTEQKSGGHADESETSVMLHLHPRHVDMSRAPRWETPIAPGRWSPDDPQSPSYSPYGIHGDASLATPDKGRRLIDAMLDDLQSALDDIPA